MIEENKIMSLSDGKVLYDDLRDRIEERGLPENGQLGQIPMKKNNGVRWADIPVDTLKADKVTGATNGNFAALDSNGNLIDSGHKHSDYLTEHQTIPVTDVKTETGTSLVNNNVAVIPRAHSTNEGTVKVTEDGALNAYYGVLSLRTADSTQIKAGTEALKPIVPYRQHESAFYGLAKAAGDTAQAQSENGVGAYTDAAKTKIQNMLNIPSANAIASLETNSTASKNYSIGDLFTMDGKLYKAIAAIAQNGAIVTEGNGQNCEEVSVDSEFARSSDIPAVPVQDVQVNGTSVLNNGIANVPVASSSAPGVVMVDQAYGIIIHPTLGYLAVNQATANDIKAGTVGQKPVVPYNQHQAAFYGLAKAAGDSTQSSSDNAVGTYTENAKSAIRSMIGAASSNDIPSVPVQDVQVNGTSILSNGVANVPTASYNALGVVKTHPDVRGVEINNGELQIAKALSSQVKNGVNNYAPITPSVQDSSAFYGLAKAAGDSTQSSSSNSVGTYTESAKSAISQMLNAPVTVSGTTPTITAKAGVQYVCGEVSTLTIVVPASGCIDVVFESGSMQTILTVTPPTGKTMKWPDWFDPDNLEANATYEINVLNGTLGVVGIWM